MNWEKAVVTCVGIVCITVFLMFGITKCCEDSKDLRKDMYNTEKLELQK